MTFLPGLLHAGHFPDQQADDEKNSYVGKDFVLKNVRLETGFAYEGDEVVHTNTGLFSVAVSNGKIKSISPGTPNDAKAVDAKGWLMLPAFKDMHIHLDKTFYGGAWQAVKPRTNGVKGMIALEQKICRRCSRRLLIAQKR